MLELFRSYDRDHIVNHMVEKLYTLGKNKIYIFLWLRSSVPYHKIQAYIEERMENH